jgi:biopolymer transport protein ExbD
MARAKGEDPKLDMTPMIDCVFQLLIFFIISLKPEDVIAHLDVNRPASDASATTQKIDILQVGIYAEGYTLNDRTVSYATLEGMLVRLSNISKTQTVVIKCALESPHKMLVEVLDLCSKLGLKNLSVMSM